MNRLGMFLYCLFIAIIMYFVVYLYDVFDTEKTRGTGEEPTEQIEKEAKRGTIGD